MGKYIQLKTAVPGPRSQELIALKQKTVADPFELYIPAFIERGHGALMIDVDGNQFIDLTGGIGSLNVGHTQDHVVAAAREQLERFFHTDFTVIPYEPLVRLADRLTKLAPGPTPKRAGFFNSGAEAVENAVKIAKAYTKRPGVLSFERAFHGRTLMAMSLTSKFVPYKKGFGPFAPEVYRAPYPYPYRSRFGSAEAEAEWVLERIQDMFKTTVDPDSLAACIFEPVQGEGGFIVPPKSFVQGLAELCQKHGIVLIADEVQTGFGRTGTLFAVEQFDVEPDLITLAKSIAGGLPLSAVVGKEQVMNAPGPSTIGGTYVGNPVACAAGLAVLDAIEAERLLESARNQGAYLMRRFQEMQERHRLIGDVRGLGAMVAIELVTDRQTKQPAKAETGRILKYCMEHGTLLLSAGVYGNCIRLLAPLGTPLDVLAEGLDVLDEAIGVVERG